MLTKTATLKAERESKELLIDAIPDRSADEQVHGLQARIDALRERQQQERLRESDLLGQLRHAQRDSSLHVFSDALAQNPGALPGDTAGIHETLRDVRLVIQGIDLATKKLQQELLQVQAECDGAACRVALPLHRQNVRHTINCVVRLHQSVAKQQELRATLAQRGVERTGHLKPLFHADFQDGMQDSNAWISFFMREAVELGFISPSERAAIISGARSELSLLEESHA